MVTILDEIISTLKTHSFKIEIKDIREPFSTKQPVYPMIVVYESTNLPKQQICGVVNFTTLAYRFEIYARDMSINSGLVSKRQVATSIADEIDDIMRTKYGMKRSMSPQILPYTQDGSVIRYIFEYKGILDNKYDVLYQ